MNRVLILSITVFLSLCFGATEAQGADVSTAVGLLSACETQVNAPDTYTSFGDFIGAFESSNACSYYLAGFLDAHTVTSELIETNEPLFCLPPQGLSPGMVTAAVGAYLKENPDNSSKSARLVIALSLKYFFPCDQIS